MNADQVIAALTAAPASMESHESAVAMAEKRLVRARQKLDVAVVEVSAAEQWLERMKAERAAFVDEQGMMF